MSTPTDTVVSEERLRECPFCGCDDVGTEKTVTDGSVWCRGCRAKIVVRHAHPRLDGGQAEAISAWNRRNRCGAEIDGETELAARIAWNRRTPAPSQTAVEPVMELVARAKKAVALGTSMGARGQHASNIYNIAADLIATLTAQAAALVAAERRGPQFEGVAKHKLEDLTSEARGWRVCGYAIEKDGELGLVTTGGFVGWWTVADRNAEAAESEVATLKARIAELEEGLEQIEGLDAVEAALDPEWAGRTARAVLRRLTHQEKNNGR